jgi:predicted small lipoprotein YifL
MKKLVLMAVAIVAVSFASCGNKQADAEKATADSIRIADSIAAVEEAAAAADTVAVDSAAVVAE